MNVLFLSMTFPDAAHRARGSYNLALCEALARTNTVRVCSPRPWPESVMQRLRRRGTQPGDDVTEAGLQADYPTYWFLPKLTQNQSGKLLDQSCRRSVASLTRDFQPDVVLSYWAHPDGEAGLRTAHRLGAKAAVIVGGTDALILPHRPGRGPHVRRVLTESDAVFTVSAGLRDAVLKLGASPDRVHVVYQGVKPELFHPRDPRGARRALGLSEDRPLLLWVGRMVEVKRLDVLLSAIKRLRVAGLDFQLALVGDGPLRTRLEQQVQQEGLSACVRFVGSVPYQETARWYQAASATLLTSDSEGLPNVLRESLACGTPFVSTDVGSIREIAEPGCSILTPKGDAHAFANGVIAILAGGFGAAARDYQARTWRDCAEEMQTLLFPSAPIAEPFQPELAEVTG